MSAFETIKERSKNLLVYGGITAMTGAAMLGVGGSVFAQDNATPTAGTEQTTGTTGEATERTTREAEYAAFLDALAVNLGVADGETVDAAIKTTLKQMVDERLAAGEISADLATELKAAIDSGNVPIGFHRPDLRGDHGGSDFQGDGSRGPGRGDDTSADDTDEPGDTDQDGDTDDVDDTVAPETGTPTAGSGVTA